MKWRWVKMEFKKREMIKIKGADFEIFDVSGNYALARLFGETIYNNPLPIVIKKSNNKEGFEICSEEQDIREALELMLVHPTPETK